MGRIVKLSSVAARGMERTVRPKGVRTMQTKKFPVFINARDSKTIALKCSGRLDKGSRGDPMGSVGVRNVWTVVGQYRNDRKREGSVQDTEDELRTTTNDESKLPGEIFCGFVNTSPTISMYLLY